MNHNTIAIVSHFGEKTNLSPVVLDLIRETITNWVNAQFKKTHSITQSYSDEEVNLLIGHIGTAAVIRNMKTTKGQHFCFSAASISDEELYLLY